MTEFPSLESFTGWLEALQEDEVLAEDWNASSCPLCVFLKTLGCERPAVFHSKWATNGYTTQVEDRLPLPGWAIEFNYWSDRSVPRITTAEGCLFILNYPYFNPENSTPPNERPFIRPAILSLL